MRFMGIIGILVFMGIAYLFSKDRKKINWQTVAWGLGLQVLFAVTILGTITMSFFTAALLVLLMTVYLTKIRFAPWSQNHNPLAWARTMPEWLIIVIAVLKMLVAMIVFGYFLGRSYEGAMTLTINIIWGAIVLIWLLRKYIKTEAFHNVPINSALAIMALNMSLGLSFAIAESSNGTQGTMAFHLQQLSIGVGNFLSIPSNAGASFIFGPLASIQEPWYFYSLYKYYLLLCFSQLLFLYYII